jgi:hypothetical protein
LEAVWIKAVGFVLVPLAEIYLQSLWRFSYLICFIKKFYKFVL